MEPAKVSAKARFKEDLSLDSLDVVEVRASSRVYVVGPIYVHGRPSIVMCVWWYTNRQSLAQSSPTPPTSNRRQVVMAIEEEFALEIPDNEADKILSIDDAVKYITAHPQAK